MGMKLFMRTTSPPSPILAPRDTCARMIRSVSSRIVGTNRMAMLITNAISAEGTPT